MDCARIVEKAQTLGDVELALLLSLMAGQHCQIEADLENIASLREEVGLICSRVFGFSHSTVQCSSSTTLDKFRESLLVDEVSTAEYSLPDPDSHRKDSLMRGSALPGFNSIRSMYRPVENDRTQMLPNVVIIENLSLATYTVQTQALELMRTRRIFTHTAVHSAPKMFAIVFLKAEGDPELIHHLNDHIFISHRFDPEDGFHNLEGDVPGIEDDQASLSSVIHRSVAQEPVSTERVFLPAEELRQLTLASENVIITAEVNAYLHNIVTFIRMHRAVAGGVSPRSTQFFDVLVKCLAPLHSLTYVTPPLVLLAAQKIYPHRITLAKPQNERSVQYGSDLAAVTALLEGYTPERVIEEVLAEVDAPA